MENLKMIDEIEDVEKSEEVEEKREVFEITSLSGADWCFERLKGIKANLEERKAYAEEEIKKYKEYIEAEEKKAADDIAYFEGLLRIYTDKRLEEDKDFKLKTAKGSASYGKVQKKWNYDEEVLLKDLEDKHLEDYIKVKKSIDKTKLKKDLNLVADNIVVDGNGEVVEGITITEFRNFNVKYWGE